MKMEKIKIESEVDRYVIKKNEFSISFPEVIEWFIEDGNVKDYYNTEKYRRKMFF